MAKTPKNITLDEDVAADVREKKEKYKIDFSAWVNEQWRDQFMSLKAKEQKIKQHQEAIAQLKAEMAADIARIEIYRTTFTRDEIRYLTQVPGLIKEGKEWNALKNRFCNAYKRDLSLAEFEAAVRRLNDQRSADLQKEVGYLKHQKQRGSPT